MTTRQPLALCRRRFLCTVAALPVLGHAALARSISGRLPWSPFAGDPPKPVNPLGWYFLEPEEVVTLEAIVDRFIPADHLSPSGTDAGCVVFIDRQLAGPYGEASRLYTKGPFMSGTPNQGYQSRLSPAERYRVGLKALNDAMHARYGGRSFAKLAAHEQDAVLGELEKGKLVLQLAPGFSGKAFFDLLLQNTMEGFFADPLYGGNRNMVSWKMIGFPGARYDYRDFIEKHNEPYPYAPISIFEQAARKGAG